jgi:hypothetical protein
VYLATERKRRTAEVIAVDVLLEELLEGESQKAHTVRMVALGLARMVGWTNSPQPSITTGHIPPTRST